jgi:hypothetical protein
MPLEKREPAKMPKLATTNMVRKGATFDPMAELRKFTASLLTPTIRSTTAIAIRMITKIR